MIVSVPEGESTMMVRTDKSGLIVPPENSKRLASAILELKEKPELYETLAKNGVLAAKKYDREKLACEMLWHLESILN